MTSKINIVRSDSDIETPECSPREHVKLGKTPPPLPPRGNVNKSKTPPPLPPRGNVNKSKTPPPLPPRNAAKTPSTPPPLPPRGIIFNHSKIAPIPWRRVRTRKVPMVVGAMIGAGNGLIYGCRKISEKTRDMFAKFGIDREELEQMARDMNKETLLELLQLFVEAAGQ